MHPKPSGGSSLCRVTFDLTGLPPTPAETEAFLNDPLPDAYERWVDRLLEIAALWRTLGSALARRGRLFRVGRRRRIDPLRDDYYHYRDYVIRTFNADKPFDRFVQEQLAGDELADYRRSAQAHSRAGR